MLLDAAPESDFEIFDPTDYPAPTPAVEELKQRDQWVAWKYVQRGTGKPTKPPVDPHTARGASHSNPATWASHEKAEWRAKKDSLAGVGFVLSESDDYTGVDLDNCVDPISGRIEPWVIEILDLQETYAEFSPSGAGIRMFVRGKVDRVTKCDKAGVEIYGKERYMTVTGHHVDDTPDDIRPAPKTLAALLARCEDMRPKDAPEPKVPAPVNSSPPRASDDESARAWAKKALEGKAADLAGTTVHRNHALNASAYGMGTMAARGWITESEVFSALVDACRQNGLYKEDGPRQCRASFLSGFRRGLQSPHEDLPEREEDREVDALAAEIGRMIDKEYEAPEEEEGDDGHGDPAKPASDPLAGFIFDGEAASLEPPPMLVKKLVPRDGICFIGGQSGAGKTFIAVDLAVSLASSEPFFGHKVVERVGVAIFAAEGASTIASRVMVARNHKAHGEILPIAWLGAVPNLAEPREVKAMVQRLRAVDARFLSIHDVRLGAVICDTLAASFSLNDENNNSEAAKSIRAMKEMCDALGVVVLPVHHFGKATDTGLRGASAWRAGCDTVLSVLADRDQTTGACENRRLALTKSRVGEEGWVENFHLSFVELGEDEDGEAYGACYVESGRADGEAVITSEPKEKDPPRAARVYLDAFGLVLGDKGRKVRPFGSEGPEVVAVDREDVRAEFYRIWAADGDSEEARSAAQRKSFKRGEDWGRDHRRISLYAVGNQHMVWLLKEEEARSTIHRPVPDLCEVFDPDDWI